MESPTAFAIESINHRSVTLTWTDAVGAVFYRLYFGTSSVFSEATMFCPILQGAGRALIGALERNTAYNFWIVAEDNAGVLSSETMISGTTTNPSGEDFIVADVKKAIYDWAVDNFGDFAVAWEMGNGTKVGVPSVSLHITGSPNFGGSDHVRNGRRLCGNRKFMVSVNVFAKTDPLQMAEDLRTSLQRPDVIDFFDAQNIGIAEINGINDLSQLVDGTTWERRAQFDFGVLVASDKEFDAGQISEVAFDNFIGR